MWLLNSSIGKKVVMSVTGLCLIFFLLFHASMNVVAVFSAEGYNTVAHFLSTNAIVQFMVPILALFFIIHIVYASVLTLQNRKARGNDRYALAGRSEVTWTAKNMYVLGVVVLGALVWHLVHFWAKLQLQEWMGNTPTPEAFDLIKSTFSQWWVVVIYVLWFFALWLHLTHGFWSAFQSIGINNKVWYQRWKVIGQIFATIVCLMFVFVAVAFLMHNLGIWDSVGHIWKIGATHNAPVVTTL